MLFLGGCFSDPGPSDAELLAAMQTDERWRRSAGFCVEVQNARRGLPNLEVTEAAIDAWFETVRLEDKQCEPPLWDDAAEGSFGGSYFCEFRTVPDFTDIATTSCTGRSPRPAVEFIYRTETGWQIYDHEQLNTITQNETEE